MGTIRSHTTIFRFAVVAVLVVMTPAFIFSTINTANAVGTFTCGPSPTDPTYCTIASATPDCGLATSDEPKDLCRALNQTECTSGVSFECTPENGFGGVNTPGGADTPGPSLTNPLEFDTIESLLDKIADILFTYSIPLLVIMIIIGAFYLITAGGSPEKIKTGKKVITWAIIGFVVILIAGSIASLIRNLLEG